jgi:hypothetical protein
VAFFESYYLFAFKGLLRDITTLCTHTIASEIVIVVQESKMCFKVHAALTCHGPYAKIDM